jgi:LysM repeat protein
MFESLDVELTFGQDGAVTRTHVRRRIAAVAVAVAVAALLGGQAADAATHGRHGAPGASGSARSLTYVVTQGDTLWAISQRFLPGQDPRDGVQAIERASHLDGPDISPGQQLTIPTDA